MKAFTIALFFVSSLAVANENTAVTLDYTTHQLIVSTAIPIASTEALTISTFEVQKRAAQKIQNEAQEYYATGVMGLYLTNKVELLKAIHSELSLAESIDALLEASEKILAE